MWPASLLTVQVLLLSPANELWRKNLLYVIFDEIHTIATSVLGGEEDVRMGVVLCKAYFFRRRTLSSAPNTLRFSLL